MNVTFHFYSISKDLAGTREMTIALPERSTLSNALEVLYLQMPVLEPLRNSTMYAVGLDYATLDSLLPPDSTISLIPPVQGG